MKRARNSMKSFFMNFLAVIVGIVIGSIVNMLLLKINGSLIALPAGVNVSDPESLKQGLNLFQPIHFLAPFLSHAGGTLVGAIITGLIAVSRKMILSLLIGLFFLMGGIASVFMLPSPLWFTIIDLVLAYLPMAMLGYFIASKIKK